MKTTEAKLCGPVGGGLVALLKGSWLYVRRRRDICFDEAVYRSTRLRGTTGLLARFWARWPKLHFLVHFAEEPAVQVEVLGQELSSLLDDQRMARRFDPARSTVVVVSFSVARTGAPKIALEILKDYARTHNTVFFSFAGGDRRREFAAHSTFCAFDLGTRGCQPQLRRQLERVLRVGRPEVAFVNSIGTAEALPVLAAEGIPRVMLIHEIADIEELRRFETVARHADATVFPSAFVRERALARCPAFDPARCVVLPQGVFEEAGPAEEVARDPGGIFPSAWGKDDVVILGAGSVNFRKGVDLFLLCASLVKKACPAEGIRFLWAGHGYDPSSPEFSGYLQHQLAAMDLEDVVHFCGEIRNMEAVYREADVFFLPSRFDPLPLVAQQAMSHALPVVCFEGAGGIPEFLRRDANAGAGVVGYLDVPAAAAAIVALARDPGLRRRVGGTGRDLARSVFDAEEYFRALRTLSRAVSGGTGDARGGTP